MCASLCAAVLPLRLLPQKVRKDCLRCAVSTESAAASAMAAPAVVEPAPAAPAAAAPAALAAAVVFGDGVRRGSTIISRERTVNVQ